MTTEAQTQEALEACQALSEEFHRIASLLQVGSFLLLNIPVFLFMLYRNEARSRSVIRKVRRSMNTCVESCDNAECLNEILGSVRQTRDDLIDMLDSAQKYPLKKIITGPIERSLYAWDDLVEDCAIGSDKEIRNLICRIAEAA